MLYKILIRPHLEYCAPIWNPHFAKDIDVLEKVQRRVTKLIPSITILSYEARLEELNIHSPLCRRQRGDLIEAYKILNSYQNINPEDIFTLQQGNATKGHQMKLLKRRINTSISQHFFTFRVFQHWNNLSTNQPTYETTTQPTNLNI